jgi:hypothetical protein
VSIATAVGVAAAAGAAQLGVAYGTGVITWRPEPAGLAELAWSAAVIWVAWIAATSVIAGAVVADRLHASAGGPAGHAGARAGERHPDDRLARMLWRLVLAIAAGIGAMITVALVAVPARDAAVVEVSAPQALAVAYAALGVLVGVIISVGAVATRAVAANLIATAGWLWALAVTAVTIGVVAGHAWSPVWPGAWDPDIGQWWLASLRLPEAAIALGAALVIGALAALPAARRGERPVGVVTSGVAGPLVLAAAYLLAQPDLTGVAAAELSRYLLAPYLVLAGLAGSLLIGATVPPVTGVTAGATASDHPGSGDSGGDNRRDRGPGADTDDEDRSGQVDRGGDHPVPPPRQSTA